MKFGDSAANLLPITNNLNSSSADNCFSVPFVFVNSFTNVALLYAHLCAFIRWPVIASLLCITILRLQNTTKPILSLILENEQGWASETRRFKRLKHFRRTEMK